MVCVCFVGFEYSDSFDWYVTVLGLLLLTFMIVFCSFVLGVFSILAVLIILVGITLTGRLAEILYFFAL